jgi:hypothetical protein
MTVNLKPVPIEWKFQELKEQLIFIYMQTPESISGEKIKVKIAFKKLCAFKAVRSELCLET